MYCKKLKSFSYNILNTSFLITYKRHVRESEFGCAYARD